jgi:putative methionine-R-sulfoxide reductase with GAF domain
VTGPETNRRTEELCAALERALTAPFERRLHEVAEVLTDALNADRCMINRVDGESLVAVEGVAPGIAADPQLARFPRARGICGRALRLGATQRVDDVIQDPDYFAAIALTRSELATPLFRDGVARLVLNVEANRVAAFSAADAEVLEAAAGHLAERLELLGLEG